MKVAIIGYGGRGSLYAGIFKEKNVEIVAVCDIREDRRAKAAALLGSTTVLYDNDKDFFAKGKLADLLVVSTQDRQHAEHALKALDLGYDLLLEKPAAATAEDSLKILAKAKSTGRKVFICHVLRYAPFFSLIKDELDSGKYGEIATINLTENVGYWHQSHSYVRGNWRNKELSSPMIIAKCCHDLDILMWYIDKKCEKVTSFGSLNFFKKENAPEGAAEMCCDCKYKDECVFSAEKIYLQDWMRGFAEVFTIDPTPENIKETLKTSPYGRCVFHCDNNVVDHEVTNLCFENGATAHLTMTAFAKDCYREIHVHCTKGDIFGNMMDNKLICNAFGEQTKVIDINSVKGLEGHGGGDARLVEDVIAAMEGKPCKSLTSIDKAIQSHLIGFAAEESRLAGGEVIKKPTDGYFNK